MPAITPPTSRSITGLEQAVRPFVNGRPTGSRRRFRGGAPVEQTTEEEDNEGLVIEWSASVETTTIDALGWSLTFEGEINNVETFRETHVERVTSDSDPDTYIDVEVTDRIGFKDPKTNINTILTMSN